MEKIIHYCWFGGKPLPKLAKKCIKSWKKHLTDYKIIEWNENNFDVNITKFSKDAYEQKKWAFVSDVARVYALKKYGGLYFDTDMFIKKNIDDILQNDFVAGWESDSFVAAGFLAVKHPDNDIINKLFDFYCKNNFSVNNVWDVTLPALLTKILKNDYDLVFENSNKTVLNNNVCIFSSDYFYPIAPNIESKRFTKNTRMIHYYNGSWLSVGDIRLNKISRFIGRKNGVKVLKVLSKIKKIVIFFFKPYFKYKRIKFEKRKREIQKNEFTLNIEKCSVNNYIVIHNPNWLGITNATKELFDSTLPLDEVNKNDVNFFVDKIINHNFNTIIYSGFANGWDKLVSKIHEKNPNMVQKIIWHGGDALHAEEYDFERFKEVFELLEQQIIKSIVFVKESMYNLYKQKGYNVEFLLNNVAISDKIKKNLKANIKSDKIKIGIYCSGERWVKNFYNQLAAASLIENVVIDCIPYSHKIMEYSKILKTTTTGVLENISREELLTRMSNNDINLYVTFTECAPLIPLESLELGVPCITANNHHYFKDTVLADYLIVNKVDDVMEIYEKIKVCLENKNKIIENYNKWKKEYNKKVEFSKNNILKG